MSRLLQVALAGAATVAAIQTGAGAQTTTASATTPSAATAAAAQARARGVRVDVVDHAPPGADLRAVGALRGLVAAVLDASTDGEITARRPPHEVAMTVVHVGSPTSMAAVAAAVQQRTSTLRGLEVELSADEDAVVVDVLR